MRKSWLLPCLIIGLWLAAPAAQAAQDEGPLLAERCGSCHQTTSGNGLTRIDEQRKTPEAWDMTLVRMVQFHGVELSDDERARLVKHLADRQGLAPSETDGFRYILERQPGVIESPPDAELATLCARCHSYARIALQRRTEDEWRKLAHFHLGQFPTAEYQALGRDRNWWEIASEQAPGQLAELFPLKSEAWDRWQQRPAAALAGDWRFVGHHPGRGGYHGTMTLAATGDDRYDLKLQLTYDDGETASGQGAGILYTGYEWRGRSEVGSTTSLQVMALAEDGTTMTGRSFLADQDAVGGQLTMTRLDASPQILAVTPGYVRAGEGRKLAIQGVGLAGDVDLGPGVTVDNVLSADDQTIVVHVQAAADAALGGRSVKVGTIAADQALVVYDRIDRLSVEPPYTIARVGGAGGAVPPVAAQFEAIAWQNGADGAPGTADDLRIGALPARWSTDNFDATAVALKDAAHAGSMQAGGLFMPSGAGPNPARPFETNNAGNLKVLAAVDDAGREVTGEGQLIVTVQRWNDPPIR